VRRHLPAVLGIFGIALAIRVWLLQGLMLGDDAQEFGVLQHVLANGPDLRDQLQVRFGGWVLNYVICALLGVSETTVILPSMLLSSALAALAYVLLVHWRYERWRAALGALLVATAPFEVMLGTCRTNDLVLGGTLAFGFAALVLLESRPVLQGVLVALALWFGFYVKLWAVYVLPGLGLYALVGRRWRAAAAFVAASAGVHGATLAYWKVRLGSYTPFIDVHAANFAVPAKDLLLEWSRYVHMIFVGSEFGTTLWGIVPWLLVLLVVVRAARGRFDRADGLLLGYWGLFFLLIEFFPNGFTFDRYYSVPRIFRYLAPLSFPIALHAAKLALDATRSWRPRWTALAVVGVLSANVLGSIDATEPGRVYRDSLHRVVRAIEQQAPPRVVAEITLGYWLESLYLNPDVVETEVETPPELYDPIVVERWIRDAEKRWPTGTLLVTGIGNYVHYGAHTQSLRLAWFSKPLDDHWDLAGEYGSVSYLPRPETARLWRLRHGVDATSPLDERDALPPPGPLAPKERLAAGQARFDAADYPAARAHYHVLIASTAPEAEDASFFYAASFFRQEKWQRASHEFKRLHARFPDGRWAAAAHWHLAIADLRRGRVRRARERFAYVIRRYPHDPATVMNAEAELARLRRRRGGLLVELWWRLTGRTP